MWQGESDNYSKKLYTCPDFWASVAVNVEAGGRVERINWPDAQHLCADIERWCGEISRGCETLIREIEKGGVRENERTPAEEVAES